ncbi:hypothetical protein QEN19_002878 [Hanseniaspora menglaensis]
MVDKSVFENSHFLTLLKQTKEDFLLPSSDDNNLMLFSEISAKEIKMIKLLALYIVTNKNKKLNVIDNIKLLYKGQHIFDWLDDPDHEFYAILDYFKIRLNIIINQGEKIFTLRNSKNNKIDSNYPFYKQILFEKLYTLALVKERTIYLKLEAHSDKKTKEQENYVFQGIDWINIVKDTYKNEQSEILNDQVTLFTPPTLDEVLPSLIDKEMNYNLDINSLKAMSSINEKRNTLKKYFKNTEIDIKGNGKKKRKIVDEDISSEQPQPKKIKSSKKKANRKVVLDPSVTRAALNK